MRTLDDPTPERLRLSLVVSSGGPILRTETCADTRAARARVWSETEMQSPMPVHAGMSWKHSPY